MRALSSLSILSLMILAACAPSRGTAPGSKFAPASAVSSKPAEFSAPSNWRPDDIEVACAESRCPVQVGVLIFAGAPQGNRISIQRCTAFLIAPDLIMSNGHCDRFGQERGFFVSQNIQGKKSIREITGVPFKRYTPAAKDTDSETGKPDVATYKLDHAITNMPPIRLASGAQVEYKKLIAYSVFPGVDQNHLKIEARECMIHRHEADFPFALREAPEVIHSYDCQMVKGNSGSPMLAPGSDLVEAVHMGGPDLEQLAVKVRQELKRELLPYEKRPYSVSTNVRCLDLPGATPISCVPADFNESVKRFQSAQKFELDKLKERTFAGSESFDVKFQAVIFQLKASNLEFEIIYLPKCRNKSAALTSVPVVIEKLNLTFDEWAAMKPESISLNTIGAEIKIARGDAYQLQVNWPAPSGEYLNPEQDLRKQFGPTFRIDIPVCPR